VNALSLVPDLLRLRNVPRGTFRLDRRFPLVFEDFFENSPSPNFRLRAFSCARVAISVVMDDEGCVVNHRPGDQRVQVDQLPLNNIDVLR